MRNVNYVVKFPNGSLGVSRDYLGVTEAGGRILRVFLTEVDERTDKYLERSAIQRAKVQERLRTKRGNPSTPGRVFHLKMRIDRAARARHGRLFHYNIPEQLLSSIFLSAFYTNIFP